MRSRSCPSAARRVAVSGCGSPRLDLRILGRTPGEESAKNNKTLLFLAASASAEFFADIGLCPLEAVKARLPCLWQLTGSLASLLQLQRPGFVEPRTRCRAMKLTLPGVQVKVQTTPGQPLGAAGWLAAVLVAW